MPSKPHSLRRRLLSWLLLPLLILFFLRGIYSYYYGHELANRVYDRMLFTLTVTLSQQIIQNDSSRQIELPQTAARLLMSDELDVLYIAIRDAQGNICYGESTMPELPPKASKFELPFYDGEINNHAVRVAYLPLTFEHEDYVLQVAETLAKRTLLWHEFLQGSLLPQAIIIILATIIVWFGVGKSLAPLKELQKAVTERSHLDLSPLQEENISKEVQPLIHSFNDLMSRLSDVLEVQNRFIADAAHQLRTPLAGLKTQIELAMRQNDPAIISTTMHNLLTSTDRMTRLVNQLLALARNEPNAEAAIIKKPVDLGLLASNLTMEWVPRALEKGIDLGFEPPRTRVSIQADATRIKDLIDNLIDNAIRYTPRKGQVTVSVSKNGRPRLTVTDNGPGIPPDQRDRVFERFYSLLGNGADGSGLGLAIVREIARMHGAETHIDTAPDGIGTRVSVSF